MSQMECISLLIQPSSLCSISLTPPFMASISLDQGAMNCKSTESTRVLEDRMVALEQDHRRLSREFESKSVIDAELACFHENVRFEDHSSSRG